MGDSCGGTCCIAVSFLVAQDCHRADAESATQQLASYLRAMSSAIVDDKITFHQPFSVRVVLLRETGNYVVETICIRTQRSVIIHSKTVRSLR